MPRARAHGPEYSMSVAGTMVPLPLAEHAAAKARSSPRMRTFPPAIGPPFGLAVETRGDGASSGTPPAR